MCGEKFDALIPEAVVALCADRKRILEKKFKHPKLDLRPELFNCQDGAVLHDDSVEEIVNEFLDRFESKITFEML